MEENKESHSFTIQLEKTNDKMEFKTIFDKDHFPELFFDEPPKSGGDDQYPNAVRILTASIINCLSASLTFCLSKSRIDMSLFKLKGKATTTNARNEQNRIRVKNIRVELEPVYETENEEEIEQFKKKLNRCKGIFEDYCVVTSSVRKGIDVETIVKTQ